MFINHYLYTPYFHFLLSLHVHIRITHILLEKNNFYLSEESSWKDRMTGVDPDVEKPWGALPQ